MGNHLSSFGNQSPKKPEIEKPRNPPEVVPEKQKENPPVPAPDVQPIPKTNPETIPAPEIIPPHESVTSPRYLFSKSSEK